MPSPFPGMDPYLEGPDVWPEFHNTVMFAFRAALNAVLPDRYFLSVDRHVWLEELDEEDRQYLGRPDVAAASDASAAGGGVAVVPLAAPVTFALPGERRTGPRFLRITDRRHRRVVTVVGLLSPSNKGGGRTHQAYMNKRGQYLASGTNLVEIDLLRSGRLRLGEPEPAPSDYYVLVSRACEFPTVGFWPFGVRDPFPPVPVPLDPDEGPIFVDFKPCADRAYDEARLDREIDYTRPPAPPLREPDATWARDLLAARHPEPQQP